MQVRPCTCLGANAGCRDRYLSLDAMRRHLGKTPRTENAVHPAAVEPPQVEGQRFTHVTGQQRGLRLALEFAGKCQSQRVGRSLESPAADRVPKNRS